MLTKIIPTWPIAVGALVIGLGAGAYVDHKVMQGRIDKMAIAHAETLRMREVKRGEDERAARNKERALSARIGEIEQEKVNEIASVRTDADALIARLREQANTKPTCPGRVPPTAPAGEDAAGGIVPDRSGEGTVRLAQRAEEQRAALRACYDAYDSL